MFIAGEAGPISIHTFLAEGDDPEQPEEEIETISIHTFLAEGDINGRYYISIHLNFNPHLPRGR